ncbi:hypothetical protein P4B35_10345 [Pontiellaceae bacterium B12227]|nr:hypothetical protein [Pontiellaceae bacterium B12227]
MYLLEIDRKHNRIHLMMSEHFDAPQAESLLADAQARAEEMETGFHVLCDLTTLEEFDPEAKTIFRRFMDLMNQRGAHKIIRIIPDPLDNFGLTVMSYFHYDDSVHIITCKTLKEALTHL